MSERIDELKAHLASTRAKLLEAIDLIGERGDEQIYSDGAQWTLKELVIHLMLAGEGHNQMVYHYTEDKPFIPEGYDIERYNRGSVKKNAEVTVEQALAKLAQSRETFLTWLDEQTDDAFLQKRGRHPAKEDVSVEEIIRMNGSHEDGHADDIVAMLQTS